MPDISWSLNEADENNNLPHFKLDHLVLPRLISQQALDRVRTLKIRDSDIFLCSYPRSGTHWLAYIVSLILHNGKLPDDARLGLFDAAKYLTGKKWTDEDFEAMPNSRVLYDHLPYQYFKSIGTTNSKYIYIARNPKEVAISNYKLSIANRHGTLLFGFQGDFDDYLKRFVRGETYYGSWLDHVSEWWEHKNDANVLFIWYEDLLKDTAKAIKKIANFLGYPLSTELAMEISRKASFDEMKSDKEAKVADFLALKPTKFYRSGTNQTWKKTFTEEQNEQIDNWLFGAEFTQNVDFS